MSYPHSDGTARPYRLWDAQARCAMRWRYYSDPKRAHIGALIEARWAKIGVTIEVYNASNGRFIGQYTRRISTVEFTNGASHGKMDRAAKSKLRRRNEAEETASQAERYVDSA